VLKIILFYKPPTHNWTGEKLPDKLHASAKKGRGGKDEAPKAVRLTRQGAEDAANKVILMQVRCNFIPIRW
jgi:hypothetical protein